jgi:hypothetical protein
VLDAESHVLIAPRLAAFRRVAGELDANRRRLEETTAELAAHPAPGRLFGGSLRKNLATVKRLRELRRCRQELTVQVDEQQRHAESLAAQIDEVVHPVLRLNDDRYQRLVAATRIFGQALSQCEAANGHLGAAVNAARTVSRAVMGKPTGSADQFRAEWAARQYDSHIRDADRAVRALPDQIAHAERTVGALTHTTVPPARMPDLTLLDLAPRTLADTAARLRIAESLAGLGRLQRQLLATTEEVRQRRGLAEAKRHAALREAYSRM